MCREHQAWCNSQHSQRAVILPAETGQAAHLPLAAAVRLGLDARHVCEVQLSLHSR